jgi:hypothetical protein
MLINFNSHCSYRRRDIELVISMTDNFTWEDLPTRDPDTGHLTKAGYIPLIQSLTKQFTVFAYTFHSVQSAVRIVMNHDMIFTTWCPFDASKSPMFEIANLIQVIFIHKCLFLYRTMV